MTKPKVETAASSTPGGFRQSDPNAPSATLVAELALFINRPEAFARQVLTELRMRWSDAR